MCYEIHTNHMHTVRLCTVHIVETRPVSCFSSVCRYSHLPPGRQHSRCLYFARPLSHRQHSDVVATPSPMLYFSFQEQIYRKEKNENRLRCNEKLAAFFGVCRAFIFIFCCVSSFSSSTACLAFCSVWISIWMIGVCVMMPRSASLCSLILQNPVFGYKLSNSSSEFIFFLVGVRCSCSLRVPRSATSPLQFI